MSKKYKVYAVHRSPDGEEVALLQLLLETDDLSEAYDEFIEYPKDCGIFLENYELTAF